jgi:hypothetical protein
MPKASLVAERPGPEFSLEKTSRALFLQAGYTAKEGPKVSEAAGRAFLHDDRLHRTAAPRIARPWMAQQAGGQRGKPSILAQYVCAFDSSAAIIGTNYTL